MNETLLAILQTGADEYFKLHQDSGFWHGLSREQRSGCLLGAEIDIAVKLGYPPSVEEARQLQAIYEQALHLARRPASGGRQLVQESIEGLGSRTWQTDDREYPEYSPRALHLLASFFAMPVRIGRG